MAQKYVSFTQTYLRRTFLSGPLVHTQDRRFLQSALVYHTDERNRLNSVIVSQWHTLCHTNNNSLRPYKQQFPQNHIVFWTTLQLYGTEECVTHEVLDTQTADRLGFISVISSDLETLRHLDYCQPLKDNGVWSNITFWKKEKTVFSTNNIKDKKCL